jgi:2-methylaconitate cis-trans-isomerase PrpF
LLKEIKCSFFRGGTSKALFIDEALLPPEGAQRDQILIKLIGSPDPKQIDGMGGGTTVTSKIAIIRKSQLPGIDVDYTFAQVVVGKNMVDYKANCGNISSAVGPYSIECGLVEAKDGLTVVRIHNVNTDKDIFSKVETPGGKVTYEGDFAISGVAGTGSKIELKFQNPGGAATGNVLPTGSPCDILEITGLGKVEVSVVDSSNLFVFVNAESVGLYGNESPEVLDANEQAREYLEIIRGIVAQKLGYVGDYTESFEKTPSVPKIAIVAKASAYTSVEGKALKETDMNIHVRMMSLKKTHKTFAMTGGMCLAAATVIPGTIVQKIVAENPHFDPSQIKIAHPSGLMDVGVECETDKNGDVIIRSTSGFRTARLLMKGTAYYTE